MSYGFTKGILIGGVIGASIALIKPTVMDQRGRKRMMKNSKSLVRRSSGVISDVLNIIR